MARGGSNAILGGLRDAEKAPRRAPERVRLGNSVAEGRKSVSSGVTPKPRVRGGSLAARALWWAGAIAIGVGSGTAGFATGALSAWLENAPSIEAIDDYNPPEMTVLLDRHGEPFARLYEEQRRVVPIGELPPQLPDAFIAIEDTEFRYHIGLDPRALLRAAVTNASRGRMSQGASTITQQLPRNLLPHVGREKTLRRKVEETLIALQMERRYSKDQILEVYLNQIYLGSGTYGVEAAAQAYFGKPAADLTLAECALLAGLPQRPEAYSPLNDPERARTRRDQVLDRLHGLGWISEEDWREARAQDVVVAGGARATGRAADYFVDAVRAEVAADAALDGPALREEGWRIRTTMDATAQRLAQEALVAGLDAEEQLWIAGRQQRIAKSMDDPAWGQAPRRGQIRAGRVVRVFGNSLVVELADGWRADLPIPPHVAHFFTAEAGIAPGAGVDVEVSEVEPARRLWRGRLLPNKRLQGAIVCLDRRTGETRALVGGRRYDDRENDGFFNRALRARRQAGSTMKPFFFAAGLEAGFTPDSVFVDEPIEYANGYRPRNFENMYFGATTLQTALEHSRNVVTIRLTEATGIRRALRRVAQFNILPGAPGWDLPEQMAAPLGTSGVTPYEIAAAYLPFANAGTATPPTTIDGILNSGGRLVPRATSHARAMLDPQTSAWMTQMMMGVMTHGSGRTTREGLPEALRDATAGKSGTTSDNRDAWFVGCTPDHVVAVWVGFDQPLPLGDERTGGKVAGPIWASFVRAMDEAGGTSGSTIAMPDGWRMELIDLGTGMRADGAASAGGALAWRATTDGVEVQTAFGRP